MPGTPSQAAQDLRTLRKKDPAAWRRRIEKAFAGRATFAEAAERLGLARVTLVGLVRALEEEGPRLDRAPNPAEERVPGNGATGVHAAPKGPLRRGAQPAPR